MPNVMTARKRTARNLLLRMSQQKIMSTRDRGPAQPGALLDALFERRTDSIPFEV